MARVTVEAAKPVTPPPQFVLTLNMQEAMVVCKLCGSIAGQSEFRDVATKVFYALRNSNRMFDELYSRSGFDIPEIRINGTKVPKPE